MSWLEKLLPPKMLQSNAERRTVPEGLWIKCPSCETVLYKTDLEQNVNVCPKCSHHHRIGARERLTDRLWEAALGDGLPAPRPGALDDDPGARERRRARQRLGCGAGLD